MPEGFAKDIFLIYLTKTIGLVTGIVSMFLVIPKLSSDPNIFGIYTVCVSLSIFFSYADLGFISAGQKFAAEYFARKDKVNEIKVVGFVLFLLGNFLIFTTAILVFFAWEPQYVIKSTSSADLKIAQKLLFILALSFPIIILQRFNALIYSVRIKDYINQLFEISGNILKIASIAFFVGESKYDIIGYFFTFQVISLLSSLTGLIFALKEFNISLGSVLKSFRFSTEMYVQTKSLAISSLMITMAWILFYELDALILSRFYSIRTVAVYAIGFSLLSFTRNLFNTLYSPFQAKFNQLNGLGNDLKLYQIFSFVVKCTLPLCLIPTIALILNMKLIVLSWVGLKYQSSVGISQLFMIATAFSAISIPLTYLLVAKAKNRELRFYALILPVIFYGCLFFLDRFFFEQTLAVAKLITVFCSLIITFIAVYRLMGNVFIKLYLNILKNLILPIMVLMILGILIPYNYSNIPRSLETMVQLVIHLVPTILIPLAIYCYSDRELWALVGKSLSSKRGPN